MRHIAMCVGNDLQFDVTRLAEVFFHVERIVAKRCFGFCACSGKCAGKLFARIGDLHAASAAACRRFDEHRISGFFGDLVSFFVGGDGAIRTRNAGNAERAGGNLRLNFVAHQPNVIAAWTDEGDAMRRQNVGEAGIFRQEPVTGVNCIRAGNLACRNDGRDVEIAFAGGRGANADAFIGKAHMHGVGIGCGVNGNRLDAHFAAGAMNAQRDFASICDENFFEHGPVAYSTMMRGSPNSTGWPSSTRISTTVPALVAGMWFMVFIASMMRTVCPTLTLEPTVTNGAAPGSAAR